MLSGIALHATRVYWGVTQFIAQAMKVPAERESVTKVREEVLQLLGGAGG
jgi:hypothetical protein